MMDNDAWKIIRERELAARVRAVNAAHKYANEIRPVLVEIFRPLVGQVVLKEGGLLAKVKKLLPEFPYSNSLHVYRHTSDYNLAWTVKACEFALTGDVDGTNSEHGHAEYYEVTVYVGDVTGKTLTKLCESYQQVPNYRTDYTVEEITAKREKAKAAEKAYDDAKSDLYPFGER